MTGEIIDELDSCFEGLVGEMDNIQERIVEISTIFNELKNRGINFNDEKYKIPLHITYMFQNATDTEDKKNTEDAILLLLEAGLDPNILTYDNVNEYYAGQHYNRTMARTPLIIKAFREHYLNLVTRLIQLQVTIPSGLLDEINKEASQYDLIREMIIARNRGTEPRKRSRYSLED